MKHKKPTMDSLPPSSSSSSIAAAASGSGSKDGPDASTSPSPIAVTDVAPDAMAFARPWPFAPTGSTHSSFPSSHTVSSSESPLWSSSLTLPHVPFCAHRRSKGSPPSILKRPPLSSLPQSPLGFQWGPIGSVPLILIHILLESIPTLVQTFEESNVRVGDKLSLRCTASGNPLPMVTWTLDGQPLDTRKSSQHQHTLRKAMWGDYVVFQRGQVVSHVNVSIESVFDGGLYSCTGSNGRGSITHSGLIRVDGPVSIRQMQNQTAVERESIWIPCFVLGSDAVIIQWTKDDRMLPFNHRQRIHKNGSLEITNLNKDIDSGTYTCSIQTVVPSSPSSSSSSSSFPSSLLGSLSSSGVEGMKGSSRFVQQSMQLKVKVPPIIEEFKFDSKLQTGMRTRIYCNVAQGDAPVTLRWIKDGVPLSHNRMRGGSSSAEIDIRVPEPGIKVRQIDEFSSALIIENLESTIHNGNYSCIASNDAATVNQSAILLVNEPPRWLIEPANIRALQGSAASIDCMVRGYPSPQVTWKRLIRSASTSSSSSSLPSSSASSSSTPSSSSSVISSSSSLLSSSDSLSLSTGGGSGGETEFGVDQVPGAEKQYLLIRSGPDYQVYENGTLRITRTVASEEFLCAASNGIGPGISEVVKMTVNIPARFDQMHKVDNVTVNNGSSVQLICSASGDSQITIQWKRRSGGQMVQISGLTDPRFRFSESTIEGGGSSSSSPPSPSTFTSTLVISSVRREDSTLFQCIGSNQFGSDVKDINVRVEQKPEDPTNVQLEYKTSRMISIQWTPPFDGNSPILDYIISVHEEPSDGSRASRSDVGDHLIQPNVTVNGNSSGASIRNLLPFRRYGFRIRARNRVGISGSSPVLTAVTDEEAPGGPPTNVVLIVIDPTTIKIQWMPPRLDQVNGQIRGYYVGYKGVNSSAHFIYKTVQPETLSSLPYTLHLQGLHPFTPYTIIIQAFNSVGAGPRSDEQVARTAESIPSAAPSDLKCLALSSESIKVSWSQLPVNKVCGHLQGYRVVYVNSKLGRSTKALDVTSDSTHITLNHLNKFTNYTVQLSAFTSVGEGPRSRELHCVTNEDIPGPISKVKVAVSSPESIVVSWTEPEAPNGVIRTYTIHRRSTTDPKVTTFTVPSHLRYFRAASLDSTLKYNFWVTSMNGAGESSSSPVVSLSLSETAPAKIVSFGENLERTVRDSVELACRAVGIPVPKVEWRKGDKLLPSQSSSSSSSISSSSPSSPSTTSSLEGGSSSATSARSTIEGDLGRIEVLSSGSLRITSLSLTHEGNFSCHVSNSHGKDDISYYLTVKKEEPESRLWVPVLKVEEVTSKSIRVRIESSSPGSSLSTNMRDHAFAPLVQKIYFKNLQPNSEWKHYVIEESGLRNDNGSFVLSNLLCGNQYQVYVVNLNREGQSVSSEILLTKTAGREPLASPATVFLTRLNKTSYRLNLNTWSNGGCPIIEGKAEFRSVRQKHWTVLDTVSLSEPVTLNNLASDQFYKVRIYMKNTAGVTSVEYEMRMTDSKVVNVYHKTVSDPPELISLGNLHNMNGHDLEGPNHVTITLLVTLTVLLTTLAAVAILYKTIQKKFLYPSEGPGISMDHTLARRHSIPQNFHPNGVPKPFPNEGSTHPDSSEIDPTYVSHPSSELTVLRAATFDRRGFNKKKMKSSSSDSAFDVLTTFNPNDGGHHVIHGHGHHLPHPDLEPTYQYLTVSRRPNIIPHSSHPLHPLNNGYLNSLPSPNDQYSVIQKARSSHVQQPGQQNTPNSHSSPGSKPRYCTPNLSIGGNINIEQNHGLRNRDPPVIHEESGPIVHDVLVYDDHVEAEWKDHLEQQQQQQQQQQLQNHEPPIDSDQQQQTGFIFHNHHNIN